jgi:hypothetical protein
VHVQQLAGVCRQAVINNDVHPPAVAPKLEVEDARVVFLQKNFNYIFFGIL